MKLQGVEGTKVDPFKYSGQLYKVMESVVEGYRRECRLDRMVGEWRKVTGMIYNRKDASKNERKNL